MGYMEITKKIRGSFSSKRKKKMLISTMVGIVALAVAIICCFGYLNDYYRADKKAIDAFMSGNSVSRQVNDDNTIIYTSENVEIGFIFYPGGKVEYTAYEPLMETLIIVFS